MPLKSLDQEIVAWESSVKSLENLFLNFWRQYFMIKLSAFVIHRIEYGIYVSKTIVCSDIYFIKVNIWFQSTVKTEKLFCIMLYLLPLKLFQHIKMVWCFSESKIQNKHTLSEVDIFRVASLTGFLVEWCSCGKRIDLLQ